ncbi:hypothetical protein ERJ75_001689600 [Trypanosoma vivax]|nr:hypothetical protein ERJ75_001689600 [Trypanosoma vivax]
MKHLRTENEGPKIQLARDTGRDLRRPSRHHGTHLRRSAGAIDRTGRQRRDTHARGWSVLHALRHSWRTQDGTLLETRRAKAGETRGRNGLERTQVARPAKGKGIDGQHLREESEAKERQESSSLKRRGARGDAKARRRNQRRPEAKVWKTARPSAAGQRRACGRKLCGARCVWPQRTEGTGGASVDNMIA